MDENEKISEQEVAEFLAHWQDFIDSDRATDIERVTNALSFLGSPLIEHRPFVLACLQHRDPRVRLGAYHTLGSYIRNPSLFDDTELLYTAVENESNERALGAALFSLGHVGKHWEAEKIMPILIEWVQNKDRNQTAREGAYEGMLMCTGRATSANLLLGEPERAQIPIDKRIDWEWVTQAAEQYSAKPS